MYPGDHVQEFDPRGLDTGLPVPGDPLITVNIPGWVNLVITVL